MLKLRPYQEIALRDLFSYWDLGRGMAPVVVLPTGAGKSLLIAAFCQRVCTEDPDVKILVVTHSIELIDQNHRELRSYYPEASTGVYSASLGHRNIMAQIIFCGIQSVYERGFDFGRVDIVIVDECHLISRKESTRYQRFFKDLKIANPSLTTVGMTATPFRLDSGLLTEGNDRLFDGIAHCTELKTLIKDGYLLPVVSKGGSQQINLENVHVQAGEYNSSELAHAADDPLLVKLAVEEIVEYGQDRKSWLVYAAGVTHAEHIVSQLEERGVGCELLTGKTKLEKRNDMIKRFREGKLRCIVNIGVLTTGFNAPCTDLIALLFSTLSTGKYVQVVGRGTRLCPGKSDCLVLDYGGNVMKHGVLDEVDPVKRKNIFCVEKRAPPMKACGKCGIIVHARTRICPTCGYEFPTEVPHGCVAYEGAMLASQQPEKIIDVVGDPWYNLHKKPGKTTSLKITYADRMDREHCIWLCLDHGGYPAERARGIVKRLGGKANTVAEAYQECEYWRKPVQIRVKPDKKFTKITGFIFSDKVQTTQQHIGGEDATEQ